MPLHVLDHDDRVVDDETHREHDGQKRQQVDREPGDQHQEDGADQRDRDGDDRDEHGPEGAEEEKDDNDDDDEGLGQRLQNLADGLVDVARRVVGDSRRHPGGQLSLDLLHVLAHALDDVQRVRRRQDPDAHESRGLAVEANLLVVVLGAEHDVGDVAQPDHDSLVLLDHELTKLLRRLEVRVRHEIDRDHGALRGPERRQVVVVPQRIAHL